VASIDPIDHKDSVTSIDSIDHKDSVASIDSIDDKDTAVAGIDPIRQWGVYMTGKI